MAGIATSTASRQPNILPRRPRIASHAANEGVELHGAEDVLRECGPQRVPPCQLQRLVRKGTRPWLSQIVPSENPSRPSCEFPNYANARCGVSAPTPLSCAPTGVGLMIASQSGFFKKTKSVDRSNAWLHPAHGGGVAAPSEDHAADATQICTRLTWTLLRFQAKGLFIPPEST